MEVTRKKVWLPVIAILIAFIILSLASPAMAATSSKTYTLNADFDEGTLVGLEHNTVTDQLQLSKESTTFPFIWVPNSDEGTVSKYDTVTGKEVARYWTGPNSGGNPSRTTVDIEGSVWFGNRNTGTVVKIVSPDGGKWVDKNGNGVCDTCQDVNSDGIIESNEVLPWNQDECVVHEVKVGNSWSGPRGIAIDSNNNLWAGTFSDSPNKFYHINGETGEIMNTIDMPYGSYGALVDSHGKLWSSGGPNTRNLLKIDPNTKAVTDIGLDLPPYGIGIDKKDHLFVVGWGANKIQKIDVTTNAIIATADLEGGNNRGVAVTNDGDVWVVNSYGNSVERLDNDLNKRVTIPVGAQPTGVAVDKEGKIWACSYSDGYLHRIDPATNSVDFFVQTPRLDNMGGAGHYSYSDMTGIIARTVTTKTGTWTVDFDSGAANMVWGTVSWNGKEPEGTSIKVEVRSSNDKHIWSAWETVKNGVAMSKTPSGQYLQIKTTLQISSGDVSPVLYDLTVKVKDANPPVITTTGKPIVLWPPNHKYQTVKVSDFITSVKDDTDVDVGINDVKITSVSSDEPEDALGEGDGNTTIDIVIKDSQAIDLRAEREGTGNGRVYTITYEVADALGNKATGSQQVWVPHDQGKGATAVDNGASAGYTVNYP
jgi:streptogramin lyase